MHQCAAQIEIPMNQRLPIDCDDGSLWDLRLLVTVLSASLRIARSGSKPMVPFWGRCTTHFKVYFSGNWDVHWGRDFDQWPYGL